ncbi:MAG: hypothetical protein HY319_15655 [Armatimonadetes bacterium]|nr:hypothetical protein [Armatimonadota bacterium]
MILKDATADAELLESFRSAYVLWHHEPDLAGATVDELYFSQFPDRLCGREDWRHAQKRSWLGLWKIQAVDQDRGLRMVDRLTGEKRYAFQRRASTALEPTDTVLGRVVDIDDEVSVLAGVEPIPLPPYAAVAARDGFLRDMFPSHTKLEPVHLRDDVLFMTLKTKWHCATSLWLRAFGADANGRIHDLSKAQSRSRNGRELLEAAGNLLLHA